MLIYLSALGCRLNEAELESWAATFQKKGHHIVASATDADTVILNTCAVTHEAVRKSRKSLQRLRRDNPTAKLVVSGCYVSLNETADLSSLGVDLIVKNDNKDNLVSQVEALHSHPIMPEGANIPAHSALFKRHRQRAFIKIQDGCRYRCTFCIVTVARGAEKSRSAQDIIREINILHQQGVVEIVLTGVHVGGYGSDLDTDLFALVSAILEQTEIPRIRFASVEPWDLSDQFLTLFDNPRLMRHMHLPLQSGCDSVLKRMARRCKTDDFEKLVLGLRSRFPDFNVTTDIIVGFPGETEQEWSTSVDFIKRIGFGHIHIFNYSVREGTKAARLPDHVEASVAKARSRELHQIGRELKRQSMTSMLESDPTILWERAKPIGNRFSYSGYTPNYHRVRLITEDPDLENTLAQVPIIALAEDEDCLIASNQVTVIQADQRPANPAFEPEFRPSAGPDSHQSERARGAVIEIKPVPPGHNN